MMYFLLGRGARLLRPPACEACESVAYLPASDEARNSPQWPLQLSRFAASGFALACSIDTT
jgi:hypothetical protein